MRKPRQSTSDARLSQKVAGRSSAAASRRASPKGTEARRRLLEESVRLIGEQGLAALSFREVARRAGFSHQAPYHHFVNREGILAAIVLEGFTRLDAMLLKAKIDPPSDQPQAVLRRVVGAYISFALDNPVHFRVMFRPDIVSIRAHPEVEVRARLAFERLADAVAGCHPQASRADARFLEVVNSLWGGAHGVATLVLDGPVRLNSPSMSFAAFVETAAKLFSEAGAKTDLAG